MIYAQVNDSEPLSQGDIFRAVPSVRVSLQNMSCVNDDGEDTVEQWENLVQRGDSPNCLFDVVSVPAIVLTPDCDALRSELITLAEVKKFVEVEGKAKDITSPEKLMRIITQHARINQKWFYLPEDRNDPFCLVFPQKMGVDFRSVISLPRADLEGIRSLRIGRLVTPAIEHFRERIAEFYRRYPYNEWYPLDDKEFEKYRQDKHNDPGIEAYPWQIAKTEG